jgi:hypothetical protein
MPEVREQAAHAAAFGVQGEEIREGHQLLQGGIFFGWLRLHAAFLRVPLAVGSTDRSLCEVSCCKHETTQTEVCAT